MNYLGCIVLILVFIQKERPHCAVQAQHLSLLSLSSSLASLLQLSSTVSLASFLQHSSKFSTRSGTSSASLSASSAPSAVGTLEANFFKCVKDSAPNWFKMPGSKSVICLFSP